MQTSSSQYDSFLFWRQPIPELDLSELEEVGGAISKPASKKLGRGQKEEEEEVRAEKEVQKWKKGVSRTSSSLTEAALAVHDSDACEHN